MHISTRGRVLPVIVASLLIVALIAIQNPLHSPEANSVLVPSNIATTTTPSIPTEPSLTHYSFNIKARDFYRHTISCCKGCELFIDFYVIRYTWWGSQWDDIIFRVVAPDGREVYPREKIYGSMYTTLTADQEGVYTLEFDNTYSDFDKYVDLAVAVVPPPQTVTSTVYRYETVTKTFTTTLERTVPVPTTIYATTTTTLPTTITQTEKVLDTATLATTATLLLAVGVVTGYFIIKRTK